jgi:hypothetical protein
MESAPSRIAASISDRASSGRASFESAAARIA